MEIIGEDYPPLGHTDFATIVNKIRAANADVVFNTLNGDSNVAFFKRVINAGLTADSMPMMSCLDRRGGGRAASAPTTSVGQLPSWNYYQTPDTPTNKKFVDRLQGRYGANRVTADPMEAATRRSSCGRPPSRRPSRSRSTDIQSAAGGVTIDAPEGSVTIDGENHHVTKTARIGRVSPNGLIQQVWASPEPIAPDPFLHEYPWAKGITG